MLVASVGEDLFRAILQGSAPGAVYALIALGFVLTYKTAGVFNLAFGAQAFVSAACYFQLHVDREWPALPSVIVAVFLLAPAIGWVLERLVFRHLRTASSVAKLVVSIGLTVALPEIYKILAGFESVAGRTPEGIFPRGASVFYDPFGVYPWNRNELTQLAVGLIGVLFLAALFRFTALGLQMRAVVESPRMTELAGIDADRVSSAAWVLSSLFAGMAGVLIAPRFNTLNAPDFFNLVVVAIAAAAVGRLVSLPRAFLGGLGLGIGIALFNTYIPRWADDWSFLRNIQDVTPSLPFIVLFGVLVFWPGIRRARDATDPLSGVDPPPPALAATTRSRELTIMTRSFGLVAASVAAVFAFGYADQFWLLLITQAVIMAIIFCSIVVITGMAGEISLCQATFGAVGAFTVFQLVDRYDMSVLAAMLVGAGVAAVVGAVVSLPVLRLGGVWLAIATLAFAYFFDSVVLKLSFVGGGETSLLQGTKVPRPTMAGIDFDNDKSFLALVIVVLVIVGILVIQVREGTTGRTLRALRGSEVAAASIGVSSARARITAFALSAAIAGLGGGLLAMHQGSVNYANNFGPLIGLFWLVIVVSIGPRTVEGAVQAGIGFALFEEAILRRFLPWLLGWLPWLPDALQKPGARFALFGLAAIQFAKHPEGLLEHGKRRSLAKQQARIDRRRAKRSATIPAAEESV